jgi:hypothetical protein
MRGWSRPLSTDPGTWRWYSALMLSNTLDLLFTYTAVERGYEEGNPVLRPLLLTPWPIAGKIVLFGLLGLTLWRLTQSAPGPRRLLAVLRAATLVYVVVLAIHALGLTLGS